MIILNHPSIRQCADAALHDEVVFIGRWHDGPHGLITRIVENMDGHTRPRIYVSSFTCSEDAARTFVLLDQDMRISTAHFVFDTTFPSHNPNAYQLLTANFKNIKLRPNHSKIFVLDFDTQVISGILTGNLNEHHRIEAGTLFRSPEVGNFLKTQIRNGMDK